MCDCEVYHSKLIGLHWSIGTSHNFDVTYEIYIKLVQVQHCSTSRDHKDY